MNFDVVIPTRWDKKTLKRILGCISVQTMLPAKCILVINGVDEGVDDIKLDILTSLPAEFSKKIVWDVVPKKHQFSENASYARNRWCQIATADYVYFIDDDNVFDEKFFKRSILEYEKFEIHCQDKIVYSPIIMRRDTWIVQSRWIREFHFSLWWPEPVLYWWWKSALVRTLRFIFRAAPCYKETPDYTRVVAVWWNSLLAKRQLFLKYPFDQVMWFVYEDLDFTYRLTKIGIPLLVSKMNRIYHMERDKTKLEQSFLANPRGAFQKSRNRILFVRKNAHWHQKIIFIVFALPITTAMTVAFMLLRWGKWRWKIISAYLSWIIKWYQINI